MARLPRSQPQYPREWTTYVLGFILSLAVLLHAFKFLIEEARSLSIGTPLRTVAVWLGDNTLAIYMILAVVLILLLVFGIAIIIRYIWPRK